MLTYVRDGGVFRLCGAPSTDLTVALLSTATSHDSISSMGDRISCTVRMAGISWITPNVRYIRRLQGTDNHDKIHVHAVRYLDAVLCTSLYIMFMCVIIVYSPQHIFPVFDCKSSTSLSSQKIHLVPAHTQTITHIHTHKEMDWQHKSAGMKNKNLVASKQTRTG